MSRRPDARAGLGALAVMAAGLAQGAPAASACGDDVPCEIEGGRYLAVPPAGWDGAAPLPVTVYFHGWQSSAAATYANADLRHAFSDAGALLVIPDGREKTWAHVGSPSDARDEIAFVTRVLDDLEARFPIDHERILVTGFSQGGSMVWDVACYMGARFTAFAPIAGAFWEPLPEGCAAPVDLRHVHGTSDTVVPMQGRPIRNVFRQGDVRDGMAIWREVNGCAAAPARIESEAMLRCEVWDDCASGEELRLCLHDGGHVRPDGWVRRIHAWLDHVAGAGR